MGFLQNLFGKKEEPIKSYADFWNWFVKNERSFYNAVKSQSQSQIVNRFFKKLDPAFNGLPEKPINDVLYKIEDDITQELKQCGSNLSLGRQSAENLRKIYYACKDFRDPSKVIYDIQRLYEGDVKMSYSIYKDKYWQTLDHFRKQVQ